MNEVVCPHIIHVWDQNGQEVGVVILGVDVFLHPFVPVFPVTCNVRTHGKLQLYIEKSSITINFEIVFLHTDVSNALAKRQKNVMKQILIRFVDKCGHLFHRLF